MRFPRLRVLIPRIDGPDPASRYPGIPATLLDFHWCSTNALNDSPGSSSGIMRPGSGRPMRRGSRARPRSWRGLGGRRARRAGRAGQPVPATGVIITYLCVTCTLHTEYYTFTVLYMITGDTRVTRTARLARPANQVPALHPLSSALLRHTKSFFTLRSLLCCHCNLYPFLLSLRLTPSLSFARAASFGVLAL